MAKVLVTGATGFIAGHVIHQLVEAGHEVRGTARDPAKAAGLQKVLSDYAGKPIKVDFVAADLSSDKGWAEAAAGMDYVQHVASPIPIAMPRDPNELIIPARDGALRVLKAAKAAGVKRVVMTSSVAAIAYGWGDQRPKLLTEEHWSNPDNLKDNTAYTRSKTIAEKAAWDYVKTAGLDLATVNPVGVLGPAMSADFSGSLEIISQPLSGKLPAVPRSGFGIVDVRDVADLHVRAMTDPAASGQRFIAADKFLWFSEVSDLLRKNFPAYDKKLPKGTLPDFVVKLMSNINPALKQIVPELGRERITSNEKAKRLLGWNPRSAEEAILSGAESLIRLKVV